MNKITLSTEENFGKLKFIRNIGTKKGKSIGLFRCICGQECKKIITNVKNGHTNSCGCLKNIGYNKKHGFTGSQFYHIFYAISNRCSSKTYHAYNRYGGRGIKCIWKDFSEFKKDMYESYLEHTIKYGCKDTSIDRIDNDGNYCKENCRWATKREQSDNTSQILFIAHNGVRQSLNYWSKKTGIKHRTLLARINAGWEIDRILSKKDYRIKKS